MAIYLLIFLVNIHYFRRKKNIEILSNLLNKTIKFNEEKIGKYKTINTSKIYYLLIYLI